MKYMNLDQKGAVLAEYVWIGTFRLRFLSGSTKPVLTRRSTTDGTNGVRSKTKVRIPLFVGGIATACSTGG